MTAFALVLGLSGVGVGWEADRPALLIFGFWVVLVGVFLIGRRDQQTNALVTRPVAPHWATLDDIYAWPTAAPGSYPDEEIA